LQRILKLFSVILYFSVEFIPHVWEVLLVAASDTQPEPTNMKNKIESIITILPTFNQRMAAEAVLELLIEGVISEREAKRQLAVNGINI
jgi:hypothetical protein